MSGNPIQPKDSTATSKRNTLRQLAEERLREEGTGSSKRPIELSPEEINSLVLELQVQKIQLELQEEEIERLFRERDALEWKLSEQQSDPQLRIEKELLELIACGESLTGSLNSLALAIEKHFGDTLCSVLLVDEDGKLLKLGAAPSLPQPYLQFTSGILIQESNGSCGTAAFRRELVVAEDIDTDPLWKEYREVALNHGLRACWSTPIIDAQQRLLGTFAVYMPSPGRPTKDHLRYIELATQIAIVAFNKDRAERELKESERQHCIVLNSIPGPVSRVDRNLRYVYVNNQYESAFGKPLSQVLGQKVKDVIGEPLFAQNEPFFLQALEGKKSTYVTRDTTPSGDLRYWLVNLVPDQHCDPSLNSFLILALDVTALTQAQAEREEALGRLQKIAREVPGVVYQYRLRADGTSCFPYASDGMRHIFFVDPNDVRENARSILELHHPDDTDEIMASIKKSALDLSPWRHEFRVKLKDGRVRWIIGNSIPEREEDGSTLWHGFLTDITERKESDAERNRLEIQLRESQKLEAIGTLAGGIAHDFNNILSVILGNVELGRLDVHRGNIQGTERSLEEIRKASERATRLVQQIISFSRRQPTKLTVMKLGPVIEESAELLRSTLPARVEVEVDIDDQVPPVFADGNLLAQVILNLATNSMQAMFGRPGRILIRLDQVQTDCKLVTDHPSIQTIQSKHPGPMVRIMVQDDGSGMDPSTLERIFEPFFTTKEVGKGTGLGLSVVHGIIQSHEGAIVVESQLGIGSTFHIYLPTKSFHSNRSPDLDLADSHTDKKSHKASMHQILLIDDDPPVLSSVKNQLECLGYLVSAHTNPREALNQFHLDPYAFALVLVDYNMPLMSGVDIARELRNIRNEISIAITSGYIDNELRLFAEQIGVQDLIPKPCSIVDLKSTVETILSRQH